MRERATVAELQRATLSHTVTAAAHGPMGMAPSPPPKTLSLEEARAELRAKERELALLQTQARARAALPRRAAPRRAAPRRAAPQYRELSTQTLIRCTWRSWVCLVSRSSTADRMAAG